ncbi:hypothetical protein [Paracoccus yeei]
MPDIVQIEVGFQGPPGQLDPEDRVRVDAAITTAETINARIGEATEAAEIATEAAEQTDADAQATEAGRQQAVQAAGDAAAARAAAALDRAAAESAARTLGATAYPARADLPAMAAAEAKAYVYADPDGLSNGLWFWTGSAWAKDGLDVAGRLRGLADASEEAFAVSGRKARVKEDGRWTRSGVEYAETGADRRPILHHRGGRRIYDLPVEAGGEFSGAFQGTVNGSGTVDDPARWARAGAEALVIGANRRAIPAVSYLRQIDSPARWARSGHRALLIGRNRRVVLDLAKAGQPAPEPEAPPPSYLPWSDGSQVHVDRQDTGQRVQVSQGGGANTNPRMQDGMVIWQSDRGAVSTYEPAAIGGLYFSPPDRADEHPVIPLQWLCCLGDSTTAGGYMGQFSGLGWSIPFRNLGRAGNTASGIAARYWAVEVSYDCPQIPGDMSEVVCAPSATSEAWPGEIVGGASAAISGWLVADPAAHPSTGTYVEVRWDNTAQSFYIRRRVAGDSLPAGKWYFFSSPTTATDGTSAPPTATMAWKFQDAILLCLLGRNSAGDPHGVVEMARRIWAAHKPLSKRIVMMPWIHGTDEPRGSVGYANRKLALDLFLAEWPDNTLDLVPWLQAAATDSAADQAALAADTPPPSLMSDTIHPGPAGRVEMARGILDFVTRKGWR